VEQFVKLMPRAGQLMRLQVLSEVPIAGYVAACRNHPRGAEHQLRMDSGGYDCAGRAAVVQSQPVITAVRPAFEAQLLQSDAMTAVIAEAARGDETAFARIVAAHHDDMVRVCQVITRDSDSANDAVQEAWAIAWRELPRLREPHRLRSWLIAIAANEARQAMRRQRRQVVTELPAEGPRDDKEGSRVWTGRIDLRNALAGLSVDDRELLALRYVAGLDSTELSQLTGLSPSGTRARLQRLLAQLRDELEGFNG
jgi:RNA polymerase sigma factor (sigma-70 family)